MCGSPVWLERHAQSRAPHYRVDAHDRVGVNRVIVITRAESRKAFARAGIRATHIGGKLFLWERRGRRQAKSTVGDPVVAVSTADYAALAVTKSSR